MSGLLEPFIECLQEEVGVLVRYFHDGILANFDPLRFLKVHGGQSPKTTVAREAHALVVFLMPPVRVASDIRRTQFALRTVVSYSLAYIEPNGVGYPGRDNRTRGIGTVNDHDRGAGKDRFQGECL